MNISVPTQAIISSDTLTSQIGDVTVEFSPEETRIAYGKNTVALPRAVWGAAITKSAVYDAVLDGSPLPAMPRSIAPTIYDDLKFGDPLAGGFFTGFHPVHRNAILITASKFLESIDISWGDAVAHYEKLGDGWQLPDRLEALVQFQRLATCNAQVEAFKENGPEAFEDRAYWTSEESQFDSDFAWLQHFGYGTSDRWGKGNQLRARPVRILFI